MDTLLKIFFGVLLGVISVLGWNWYEAHEAAKRGLVPGWVSADPADDGAPAVPARQSKPVAAPATAKSGVDTPFGRRIGGPADTSTSTPQAGPTPSGAPKITMAALSAQPSRWPKSIKLTKSASIPLQDDGGAVGEIALSAGESVELLRVQANGILQVRAKGQTFYIPGSSTNVLDAVAPPAPSLTSPKASPQKPVEEPVVESSTRPRRPMSSGEETPFGNRQTSSRPR